MNGSILTGKPREADDGLKNNCQAVERLASKYFLTAMKANAGAVISANESVAIITLLPEFQGRKGPTAG